MSDPFDQPDNRDTCQHCGSPLYSGCKACSNSVRDGLAKIREIHATPGRMSIDIETDPALAQYICQCLASMVAGSPNYTEMQFTPAGMVGQRITVTVQKVDGKTPHELRREAETTLMQLREELAVLKATHHRERECKYCGAPIRVADKSQQPDCCNACTQRTGGGNTELEALWRNGRTAWAGVPSASEWVDELRGSR